MTTTYVKWDSRLVESFVQLPIVSHQKVEDKLFIWNIIRMPKLTFNIEWLTS